MRINYRIILILFLLLFSIGAVNAQGALCEEADPFCAGNSELVFPNSNSQNSQQITAEAGPYYTACDPAFEPRYPSWFFLQIENSGNLNFTISQNTRRDFSGAFLDVDFIVWGPFTRGEDYCSSVKLDDQNMVDCSYLPDSIERMSIPNAEANEIYVVMITNYESDPGFISLEQTNTGEGSTDCSILNLDLGGSISVCNEDQYILDGTTDEDATYEWFVFNENTAQYEVIPNEEDPTYTVTESGDYRLIVTDEIENKSEQDDVSVTFYDAPVIGELGELAVCREGPETIDLREGSADLIEPNADPSNYEVFFYESTQDIEDSQPVISPQTYPFEDGKTLYAQVRDKTSGCFSETRAFKLTTFDFPEYELPENLIFCVDINNNLLNPVTIGEDLGVGYFYEWFDGEELISTSAILSFTEFPSSEIKLRISHPESGCELEFATNPVAVSRPEMLSVAISGSDFGDGYTVEATPENIIGEEYAKFEYRLDNGNWRESNIFSDVPPGSHVIITREINGCGETTSESFFLVGYPRFFSPNSDGYNDTWNLITDNYITIKKLYVFDRYGKLISKLNPNQGKGWDGTYNGQPLPADDYWFKVEFVDEKTGDHREYMSNFTLMR